MCYIITLSCFVQFGRAASNGGVGTLEVICVLMYVTNGLFGWRGEGGGVEGSRVV